jgi:hypothetical protein
MNEGEQTSDPPKKPATSASIRRPVVVRRQPNSVAKPTTAVQQRPPVAIRSHRKPTLEKPRIGREDFSRNILSPEASERLKKRAHPSAAQRLFFDASIAIATISFTILVIAHH